MAARNSRADGRSRADAQTRAGCTEQLCASRSTGSTGRTGFCTTPESRNRSCRESTAPPFGCADSFPRCKRIPTFRTQEQFRPRWGPMVAMLTPGHSPGHLCFYFPEKKILLAGDQLLTQRKPHLEWTPKGDALNDFRSSLERMAGLDVEWVLPSHGRPYDGPSRAGCGNPEPLPRDGRPDSQSAGRAGSNPRTKLGGRRLARKTLPPFEHRTAVFEILAYLQHPD